MYVVGFVIPVPMDRRDAYLRWSHGAAALLKEYGCLEVVEAWEDNVPDGKYTDFRRAVDARRDEKIVFSWQKWPDRAAVDAVEKAMSEDPRFEFEGEIPFSQRRLLMGGFTPIVAESFTDHS